MSRVLVIDDHDPSRKNLIRILNESGYEVAGEDVDCGIAPSCAFCPANGHLAD